MTDKLHNRLRVLITSGGTTEPIDSVRSITNTSTGRLGSLISDAFVRNGAYVTYLCSESAKLPARNVNEIYRIRTVDELNDRMKELLTKETYDCVVHAMAVSDYSCNGAGNLEQLAEDIWIALNQRSKQSKEDIKEDIIEILQETAYRGNSVKKLSSDFEQMFIFMNKTPKIINLIKETQPDTILVGFKLLVDVTEEELQCACSKLMERAACDFVLGNDLRQIQGDNHRAFLIGHNTKPKVLHTKQEIAVSIAEHVLDEKKRRT